MARSFSPSCGPAEPAQSSQMGASSPSPDEAFSDSERPTKRRRSNTIPDSQDDVSRYGSPDYEDDDTAIALQFEMDMDATIKTEPASQGEPMMTSGREPLPFEPRDDYEPFDGADYTAGGQHNDAASDTSELSAGFFEDVRADLKADLDGLVSEAPNVKGQFSREGCRDLRHSL